MVDVVDGVGTSDPQADRTRAQSTKVKTRFMGSLRSPAAVRRCAPAPFSSPVTAWEGLYFDAGGACNAGPARPSSPWAFCCMPRIGKQVGVSREEDASLCRVCALRHDGARGGSRPSATGTSRLTKPTLGRPTSVRLRGAFDGSAYTKRHARAASRPDRRHYGQGWVGVSLWSATTTAVCRSRSTACSRSITTVFRSTITAAISAEGLRPRGADGALGRRRDRQRRRRRLHASRSPDRRFEGFSSIDNTNASYFRDPSNGQAFVNVFGSTARSKLAQLRQALLLHAAPVRRAARSLAVHAVGRKGRRLFSPTALAVCRPHQKSIWEAAASCNGDFGAVSYGLSAANGPAAHDDDKTPGTCGTDRLRVRRRGRIFIR